MAPRAGHHHLASVPVHPSSILPPARTPGGPPGSLSRMRLGVNVPNFGPGTVVLDPFNGDPEDTTHPEAAWRALATVAERCTE
jgi:hypothetical protein